jgi:hypothetical protein
MRPISQLEQAGVLDRVVAPGQRVARWLRPGPVRDALNGVWLGHPLHPVPADGAGSPVEWPFNPPPVGSPRASPLTRRKALTLPTGQRRALDAIDNVLQSAEPRLATMFGVFTDLTRLDAMPAVETLQPGPWWSRHRLAGPLYRPGWSGHQRHRPGQRHQPGRRSLRAGRRLSRVVLIPLLLAAVSLVVVSLASSGPAGRRGCSQAVAAVMAARLWGAVSHSAGSGGTGGTGCPSGSAQPVSGGR